MSAASHSHAINLLPWYRRAALRRRARLRTWTTILSCYAAVVVATWCWCGLGSWIGRIRGSGEVAGKAPPAVQIAAADSEIESVRKQRDRVRTEILATRRKLEAAKAVGHHADWSLLLKVIASLGTPPNPEVAFQNIDLRPRPAPTPAQAAAKAPAKPGAPADAAVSDVPDAWGYSLSLDGLAASQIDVLTFVRSLQELQLFETVTLLGTRPYDSTAPDAPGLHLVSFQIVCTMTDAAAAPHLASGPVVRPKSTEAQAAAEENKP